MDIFSFRSLIKLSLLSKIIPKSLSVDEIILLLNIITGSWVSFLEKTIYLACFEGSELNDIFHLKAQLDIRFRYSLRIAVSLSLSFKTENIYVSSANIFILDLIPSGILLIKIRKNSGPNIEP